MSCCISIDNGPEVMTEEIRKARKAHRCCECGGKIAPSDTYEYVKGLWDGDWSEFKTCEKCADLRSSLMEVSCPGYGDLAETYIDWLDEIGWRRPPSGSHAAKLVSKG